MEGLDVGIWATSNLGVGGSIFAVGGMANEFSDWGAGRQADARLSWSDDGAREVAACVR